MWVQSGCKLWLCLPISWRVCWCECAGSWGFRTHQNAGSCPLVVCSLLLFALLLFPWCVACRYGFVSRFGGVFSAVWGCCVGLCCLGGLRGLWGFCARVELGGLKACGVFAVLLSVFPLLCLYLIRFSSSSPIFWGFVFVVLGLSCLPVLFVLVWLLFLFPLRMHRQKERAQSVFASSLVLLCVFLQVLKHYRYLLRFIVPVSLTFANDSYNLVS